MSSAQASSRARYTRGGVRNELHVRRGAAILPHRGASGGVVDGAEERVHEAEDAADGEEPVPRHPALRQLALRVGQRAEHQQRERDDEDHPARQARQESLVSNKAKNPLYFRLLEWRVHARICGARRRHATERTM